VPTSTAVSDGKSEFRNLKHETISKFNPPTAGINRNPALLGQMFKTFLSRLLEGCVPPFDI